MTTSINTTNEILILTEHFAPSTSATAQLVTDLADDLHRMGVSLRVLTNTHSYANSPYPVLRFSSSGSRSISVGIISKLISGVYFFVGTTIWLLMNIKKSQTLFIVSNPPFIGLIGILLSVAKGTRYVFLLQDVFPRSASLTGILPSQGPLLFFWRSLMRAVMTRSQANIVLSEAMTQRASLDFGHDIPLSCIFNWAVLPPQSKSKKQSSLTNSWDIENTFTIQYSGNFGRLHDILTLLEAARLLQDHPIKFLFIGGGAKSAQLVKYSEFYGLKNVLILPYQPRCLLSDSLAACDLSVVSLIPGAEDTVAPSKFYGILASSKPVLLIASENSELASIISRENCGFTVSQGDVVRLVEIILCCKNDEHLLATMGANARHLYEEKYSRATATSQYYQLLLNNQMI